MKQRIIEDMEILFKGLSVMDEFKRIIDESNESDKELFYYMISCPVATESGSEEIDIQVKSCPKAEKPILKENETLVYPALEKNND